MAWRCYFPSPAIPSCSRSRLWFLPAAPYFHCTMQGRPHFLHTSDLSKRTQRYASGQSLLEILQLIQNASPTQVSGRLSHLNALGALAMGIRGPTPSSVLLVSQPSFFAHINHQEHVLRRTAWPVREPKTCLFLPIQEPQAPSSFKPKNPESIL